MPKCLKPRGPPNSFQVRYYQYGYIGSLWPEQSFYPEPFEPLPEVLDWKRKGAGAYVPLAKAIKSVVSVPVITVGRMDPDLGEKVLRDGDADFIGMCRRLLADPELPNKVLQGRPEDVAPCTACLHCLEQVRFHKPMRCRINAALGMGPEFDLKKAEKRKKVLVAGGGPAGMEAARVAALRGHDVTLYAKENNLGGLLPTAALIKGTEIEDLVAFVNYFKVQLEKLGVKVSTQALVDDAEVRKLKPDVIVLATGGILTNPVIPGIDRPNVLKAPDLHKKIKALQRFAGPDLLRGFTRIWMPIGKRVVIIGGAMQGCELAEFLTLRGREVAIVEQAEKMGEGMGSEKMSRLFKWMAIKGVKMIAGVREYREITADGLRLIDREGKEVFIDADTIITAIPAVPDAQTVKRFEGKTPEVICIGDCREPGLIAYAVADGAKAGRQI